MQDQVAVTRTVASRLLTTVVVMAATGVVVAWTAAWLLARSFGSPDVLTFWPLAWGVVGAAFAAPLWLIATTGGESRTGRVMLAVVSVLLAGAVMVVVAAIVRAWGAEAYAVLPAVAAMGLAIWSIWFAVER